MPMYLIMVSGRLTVEADTRELAEEIAEQILDEGSWTEVQGDYRYKLASVQEINHD
jgi:hypothetical protein